MIFPRELLTRWWENVDRRFAAILLGTVSACFLLIFYLINNLPAMLSQDDLARIQQQFAKLVLSDPPVAVEAAPLKGMPSGEAEAEPAEGTARETSVKTGDRKGGVPGPGSGSKSSGENRQPGDRRSASGGPGDVSRTGILGMLAGGEGSSGGSAADDILGRPAPEANLGEMLSSLGGIRGSGDGEEGDGPGNGNRSVRGSRESGGGNIDALVEGLGEGKAQGVARSGELVFKNEEPLIETEEGQPGGGRSQDEVAAIVARHSSAIQFCYQRELKRNPNLRGKLVIRFVISPAGAVASAVVLSSNLGSKSVEKCVVDRIMRWDDFGAVDPRKGKTTIRQVYTFGY